MFIADFTYPVAKPLLTANAFAAQEHTRRRTKNRALPKNEPQLPVTALPLNVKKSSILPACEEALSFHIPFSVLCTIRCKVLVLYRKRDVSVP